MKNCDRCDKIIKENDITNCPTCGYVYCPECVEKTLKEDEKAKCLFCNKVLDLFDL